ncbi:MAG TPA: PaaI family thioesterase [Acidimicrobiales bacterium]|jgi:acyl-CoA thioesterase|nr:PaaI family thioesterase [Acidimicrobiales bacterium]HJM97551.1 PaaI family thioesterase [Acidimicrobiales bacterium]
MSQNGERDSVFPLRTFLDFTIQEVSEGVAVAALDIGDRHLNPNGVIHGGVIFTLADTAMGKATMSVLREGQICASIELSVRYLRPINKGKLIATASVIKAGKSVVHLESRVVGGDDEKLIAIVNGSFAVINST